MPIFWKITYKGHKIVLGMDANDDLQSGQISKDLNDIGMFEAILKFHTGKSPLDTCATNKNLKVIDSS